MKPFMTATEIAEANLPELPTKRDGVTKCAKRESWPSQPRAGRGGGREYAVTALPQRALSELAFRDISEIAKKQKKSKAPLDPYNAPKSSAQACILQILARFTKASGLGPGVAVREFAAHYNAEELNIRPWILEHFEMVAPRTLRYWNTVIKAEGTKGLENKTRRPKANSQWHSNEELRDYIIAQIAGRPHVSATAVYDGAKANFKNVPSLRSVQRYMKKFKRDNKSGLLYAADPDKWKSHNQAAFGSMSEDVVRLNQKWEIDGTIADVHCIMPSGQLKRYSLVAIVDVFSRRAKVLVVLAPSAIATACVLRSSILDWGLPEILKADNGKDYTAAHVNRIAADLGFAIDYCTPFTPEMKPHVERFFGTLTRELFEIMPAYSGHTVADAQAIRSRKSMGQRHAATKTYNFTLSPGQLQGVINSWLSDIYEIREHSGIKKTPFQKALEGRARRIENERALDLLLAPAPDQHGVRLVQKKGISVYNNYFIAPELAAMIGERVSVKIDPQDPGRLVVYTTNHKEFICIAEDPAQTGADRRKIALRAKQVQVAELKIITHQLKAAKKKYNPDKFGADVLAAGADNRQKLSSLNLAGPAITPASIERERGAVLGIEAFNNPPSPPPLSPEQQARAARQLSKLLKQQPKPKLKIVSNAPTDPNKVPDYEPTFEGRLILWKWSQGKKRVDLEDYVQAELVHLEKSFRFKVWLKNQKNTEIRKLGEAK